MKLLTWNCQMAFKKKSEQVLKLQPDLAVIPEMGSPQKLGATFKRECSFNLEWTGRSETKGLGVLINPAWSFQIAECYRSEFELFLPIQIEKPVRFNLLAVWAFNHRAKQIDGEMNLTVEVIKHYSDWINSAPTVVMGDFNNSVIWDKPSKPSNFRAIASFLDELKLVSLYHQHLNQDYGSESSPTLCMRKDPAQPYHVDYLFVPKEWIAHCLSLQLGGPDYWLQYSDHMPLGAELDFL